MDERERPRGRDAVMSAVVGATIELLAEVGPRTLSVRQVAERAGVSHTLVHRHFGTKDEIILQAMLAQSTGIADEIRAGAQGGEVSAVLAMDVLLKHPTYWATLARVLLDDPDLAVAGSRPTTELFGAELDRRGDDLATAAAAACLMLGWKVFGQFAADTIGVDREALDQRVSDVILTLLR